MTKRELNPAQGFSLSAFFGCGVASAWLAAQPDAPTIAVAIGGGACLALLGCIFLVKWNDTRQVVAVSRHVAPSTGTTRAPLIDRR